MFFVNASIKSFLRGGKGGFGSLLKGQSKKAAAKTTLDFGACRDLTGRRLRHINDEIKLRKWHQAKAMQQQGITINEDEHYQTKSGIDNWFLDIPNWAMDAFSDKSRKRNERRIQRSIQRQQHDQQQRQNYQQEKQQARERQIMEYVALADVANPPSTMDEAIAQGMKRRRQRIGLQHEETSEEDDAATKKQKMDDSTDSINDVEDPTSTGWFCSLSGDMQTDDQPTTTTTAIQEVSIQATSDFSTGVVLLPNSYYVSNGGLVRGQWYYEVILTTGHIAQIGWASKEFSPDSSAGNGVGDDTYSYGYDGSRGLLFHGSNNETTVPLRWKPKDIVGCLFDADDGIISYTLNGTHILGATFSIPKEERRGLFPAVSLNLDQVLKVRISNLSFLPKGYKEISNVIIGDKPESSMESVETYPETPPCLDTTSNEIPNSESSPTSAKTIVSSEESVKEIILPPLDTIESFNSVEEVMELGLETLKSYLTSIGIKCGGTLRERAARLFSLKGLQRDQYPEKLRAKNVIP